MPEAACHTAAMGSAERKPSLEAPSLGFRRRKKKPPTDRPEQAPRREPTEAGDPPPVVAPETEAAVPDAPESVHEETVVETEAAMPDPPELVHERERAVDPEAEAPVAPESVDDQGGAVEPVPGATLTRTPPERAAAAEQQSARPAHRPVNGHLAAAGAGVAVAVFLVAATFGGLQACQSIRGTSSCGGGPGFLMLSLIVVVAVVLGAAALRAARVPSAGSISFLAVALVSVISVLFLLDALDRAGGAISVGLVTVAAYLLSHWVTVRYIDAVE